MIKSPPPSMSVVLLTPDCLETIRITLKHLGVQSARSQLEIVLILPSGAQLDLGDTDLAGFARIEVVRICDLVSTAAARVLGIRRANAPLIAFVEDHSFPDPHWAESLIVAHRQTWAAVGPVLENANPRSAISWANLLIEYGEWLDPYPFQTPHHLPGHNSSYKRPILLEYGERLKAMMQAETVLHWDLRAQGYGIAIERGARTKHLNFSRLAPSTQMRFWSARLFSAARSRDWSAMKRLVYACGGPLIPLVRFRRILGQMRRHRWRVGFAFRVLSILLLLLVCDAGGEVVGYVFGAGDAEEKVATFEFHRQRFLNQQDLSM